MNYFYRQPLINRAVFSLFFTLVIVFLPISLVIAQTEADSVWSFEQIRTDRENDGVPDFLGEKVTVTGIANTASGLLHEQYLQIFIQNDTTGLSIFSYNIDTPIFPGDSLKVWGFIDTYNGLVEVEADSYKVIQRRSLPKPGRLNDAIDEPAKYLGVLVEGEGTIIEKGSTFNGIYVVISPENHPGNMMVYVSNFHVRFSEFNFDVLSVGDKITVQGVITEYNPEFPEEKNYKLFLRTPNDLSYIGLPVYYLRMIFWAGLGLVVIMLAWYLILRYRVKSETKDIQFSLQQKELLLKEIHHRVKNSLSIVSGLLEIQSMSTENEETIRILQDSQSRIQSIALIHEKLYKTDSLSEIELDVYIKDLVESIHRTFADLNEKVTLNFNLEPVQIDSDRVIHFGLLINELVVNSYKHAFKQSEKGELNVKLIKDGYHIQMTIADNGPGLPGEFNPTDENGLGSMLINTFSAHLEAEMNVSTPKGGGTSFTFTIPIKSKH